MRQTLWRGYLKRYGQKLLLGLLALLVLTRFGLMLHHCAADTKDHLLIDVLDVGQSDAILLRCQGESLLVDTGTASAEAALIYALRQLGVTQLNTVCVTHPHEDHYGNARRVLSTFSVGSLLLPDIPTEDAGYKLLLDEADALQIPTVQAVRGMTLLLGNCRVTVLSAGGDEANNGSVILRVTCGSTALLLMGDAESSAEEALLAGYEPDLLDCDFLKVGHHGSDTATTAALLAVATPTLAAISCGKDNEYGFPHETVLENLAAAGVLVYRTDLSGTLRFASDGQSVYAREED